MLRCKRNKQKKNMFRTSVKNQFPSSYKGQDSHKQLDTVVNKCHHRCLSCTEPNRVEP